MKNKLTTLFTFLFILFAVCSAFFGTPGDDGESIYDSMTVPTEVVTEATEESLPPETEAPTEQTEASTMEASPALSSPADILEAAYALSNGEFLEGEHTLTGTITYIVDRYSEKYSNISVNMVVSGQEHRPIQCYRLTGNDCEHIAVGDVITVTGRIQNYKGTIEFAEDCYLSHVEWGTRPQPTTAPAVDDAPSYSTNDDSKDAVAAYIHAYGCLPDFYMTKNEAEATYGWEGGPLDKLAPGMAIGGDRFTNYQKILPTAPGRTYTECDIDTIGADARGAKRIVFSNDGLVYYTDDHYDSFELLYGEP